MDLTYLLAIVAFIALTDGLARVCARLGASK